MHSIVSDQLLAQCSTDYICVISHTRIKILDIKKAIKINWCKPGHILNTTCKEYLKPKSVGF